MEGPFSFGPVAYGDRAGYAAMGNSIGLKMIVGK
jgi:hypothetical protein